MRRIIYIVFALLMIVVISAAYIGLTESGLNRIFVLAKNNVPGSLSIKHVNGRLAGPITLDGFSYNSDELRVDVDSIRLDWKPLRLLLLHFDLSELHAAGIRVEYGENRESSQEGGGLPEISLPLDITVDDLVIRNIFIFQTGTDVPQVINEVLMKAEMESGSLRVDKLSAVTEEFSIALQGDVRPEGDYPVNIQAEWKVRPVGFAGIAGSGSVIGTMKELNIEQSVMTPVNARLHATVYDVLKDVRWDGDIGISDLFLPALNSTWPEISVSTQVRSSGAPDQYSISLSADISGDQIPGSDVQLNGSGTRDGLDITSLFVKLLDGEVNADATVRWEPSLDWKLSFYARSLNPGVHWSAWPGKLNVTARAEGGIIDGSLRVSLDSAAVEGELRGYQFKAGAVFEMADDMYRLPQFELHSGTAHLSASGLYSDIWDLEWDVKVPALGELYLESKGAVSGHGKVSGERVRPIFTAHVKGSGIAVDAYQSGNVGIDILVDITDSENSVIDIHAEDVWFDTQQVNMLTMKAGGKIGSHNIMLSAGTEKESLQLSVDAGYKEGVWAGNIEAVNMDLADFGKWKLKEPNAFSISSHSARAGNLCLIHDSASACVEMLWTDKDGLDGNAGLSNIPLSLFSSLISSDISIEGELNGSADIIYRTDKLHGSVSAEVREGSISYSLDKEKSVTIPLDRAGLDTLLNDDVYDVKLSLLLQEKGHVNAHITLPHFTPLDFSTERQKVFGQLNAELEALDLIPLFTSTVENTKGIVSTDLNVSGTLAGPEMSGHMTLHGGRAGVPSLGIDLEDINLNITVKQDGEFIIDAKAKSGSGAAQVSGSAYLQELKLARATLRVHGEDFEAVRIPELLLIASPDINIKLYDGNIDIDGTLTIPEAFIEPPDLSGAVPASKDVLIVSESSSKIADEDWKVNSQIKLILGDKVSFKGFGLACRIAGGIQVSEEPGRPAQARGGFNIFDGQYKAYGQDLTIEKGRLLFVGPMDDPGLDVRAVRKIEDIIAGINVSGTLKSPDMRVFSIPSMDGSDALSYLLFGRPMNSLSSSEGQELHDTATSAYLSGGGFVAKKIGAAFGIEEVEIEKGDTVEQSALVLGKYLSPRLYVSYGIGLFEPINTLGMRYNLTPRWLLQTEYGIESGGDVLYQIEK